MGSNITPLLSIGLATHTAVRQARMLRTPPSRSLCLVILFLTLGVNVVVNVLSAPYVGVCAILDVEVPQTEGIMASVDAVERIIIDANKRLPVSVSLSTTRSVKGKTDGGWIR